MGKLSLNCHEFIPSCLDCGTLISEGETVFLHLIPDRFTDENFSGQLEATVALAFKECDTCYNYVFEYDDADLPEGIAAISECDLLKVGCEGCPEFQLTVSGGTGPDDFSGGEDIVNDGRVHFWSETLDITVEDDGRVRIELPGSYYVN